MSKNHILTLDDLYNFYSSTSKRSRHFSAKDEDNNIVVQVNGNIVFEETDDATEGLTKVVLQANHTGKNINGSKIDDAVVMAALPSFSNRPIMAYIHLVDGQWEFYDHRRHIEDEEIVYDERPVGIIPESSEAHLEYDEEKKKTYVVVNGYLFDEYSRASEIVKREGECPVSVELCIRELSYDAKEKVLNIENYYYNGVTLLGKTPEGEEVKPGMVGSNIKLGDFTQKSSFSVNMIEILNEINEKLDQLSIDNNLRKEENLMDFEENAEVIETPAEETVEQTGETEEAVNETAEAETSTEENTVTEEQSEEIAEETPSEEEKFTKTFEISHEDIRYALYNLIASFEEEDNEWYSISAVYDDYFIYEGMFNATNKFRQDYTKNENDVSLNGERIHMNVEYLSDSELAALNAMRSNYDEISQKLAKYEAEPEKLEILNSEDYALISDNEEFVALKEQDAHFDLSVEEVKNKANEILLNAAKSATFASNPKTNKITTIPVINKTTGKTGRYGGLFNN